MYQALFCAKNVAELTGITRWKPEQAILKHAAPTGPPEGVAPGWQALRVVEVGGGGL